jgi:hypothetical protein
MKLKKFEMIIKIKLKQNNGDLPIIFKSTQVVQQESDFIC